MEQVRICALGGLDENGKNCYVIEIDEAMFIIEAGFKYPEIDQLGIESIIPDFEYIYENRDRVKGVFITHGHDDVLGALPYLLKDLDVPVFTTPMTGKIIQEYISKVIKKRIQIKLVKRNGDFQLGGINFKTFSLNHSIPDAFGLAFETKHGYIVYAGEYVVDFDVKLEAFSSDITSFAQMGKKGVLCLMSESSYADRPGYTAPNHRISEKVEPYFQDAKGRIIVTLYEQNMFRLIEILDLAQKFNRQVVFMNDEMHKMVKLMGALGYYTIPLNLESSKETFNNEKEDVVIIVSGSGPEVFFQMNKIAINEDSLVELKETDTVIIASPIVPGTDIEAAKMENELYKAGVIVRTLNRKEVVSMHPSIEDLKMFNYLFKPKYYMPIIGEYSKLVQNANIALSMGFRADHILVLDNGQVATFVNGQLKDMATWVKAEEVMVDGIDNFDSSGMVLKDREIIAKDGVIIIGVAVDYNTKKIIAGPDIQIRGLIYLKDSDYMIKEIVEIVNETIAAKVAEDNYNNAACRLELKEKIGKYVTRETGKRPMLLPTIIEIRN